MVALTRILILISVGLVTAFLAHISVHCFYYPETKGLYQEAALTR
jgi:hypothetical protein